LLVAPIIFRYLRAAALTGPAQFFFLAKQKKQPFSHFYFTIISVIVVLFSLFFFWLTNLVENCCVSQIIRGV